MLNQVSSFTREKRREKALTILAKAKQMQRRQGGTATSKRGEKHKNHSQQFLLLHSRVHSSLSLFPSCLTCFLHPLPRLFTSLLSYFSKSKVNSIHILLLTCLLLTSFYLLPHLHTHSLTRSFTHSLTLSLSHSLTLRPGLIRSEEKQSFQVARSCCALFED